MNPKPEHWQKFYSEGNKTVRTNVYEVVRERTLDVHVGLRTVSGPLGDYPLVLYRKGRPVLRRRTDADGRASFSGIQISAYALVSGTTQFTLMNLPLPMPGKVEEGDELIAESTSLLARGRFAQAYALLKGGVQKVKCRGRWPRLFLNLSRAHTGCGRRGRAIRALSTGIRLAGKKREVLELLQARAELYIKQKKWKKALRDVESGLLMDNKDAELLGTRVLVFTNHPVLALQAYEQAVKRIGKKANDAVVALYKVLKHNGLPGIGRDLLTGFSVGLGGEQLVEFLVSLDRSDCKEEMRSVMVLNRRLTRRGSGDGGRHWV